MKRIATILTLVIAISCARAQTLSEYLQLRKKYGISQAVGVQALETMVGSRTVEVQGKVKGTVSSEGRGWSILLEKTDGDTMYVHADKCPGWLNGNDIPVRLLVNADRRVANGELRAELIGAASEASMSEVDAESAAKEVRTSRRTTRSGMKTASRWNVSASSATPLYAAFIKHRNSRLSNNEASRIAEGVIGFSLQYGVDARLIMAMLMVESGFNPNATSRTGAMGLGQLMPGTAAGMGVSNAYDSIDNLYGTVRLIRGHLERYSRQTGDAYSSLVLALAAYNAGAGAVSRHGGVPPYRETQNYVRKVVGIYRQLCGS